MSTSQSQPPLEEHPVTTPSRDGNPDPEEGQSIAYVIRAGARHRRPLPRPMNPQVTLSEAADNIPLTSVGLRQLNDLTIPQLEQMLYNRYTDLTRRLDSLSELLSGKTMDAPQQRRVVQHLSLIHISEPTRPY